MKKFKIALSWLLGGTLLLSAILKVMEPTLFTSFVDIAFSIIQPWSFYLFLVIVIVEIVLGLSLIFLYKKRWTFLSTGILLILFCSVIIYSLAVGLQTSCGCFGSLFPKNGVSLAHLIRNGIMAFVAFGVVLWPIKEAE